MRLIFSALIALFSIAGSTAKADSFIAVEGYVFNQATGKPVYAATIVVEACGEHFSSITPTATDANGFYSTRINGTFGPDATSRGVIAECETPRGVFRNSIPLYTQIAPGVYRRDIYLYMDKKIHNCIPHSSSNGNYPTSCQLP